MTIDAETLTFGALEDMIGEPAPQPEKAEPEAAPESEFEASELVEEEPAEEPEPEKKLSKDTIPRSKPFTVWVNGEKQTLPPDAVIMHKVDGQTVKLKVEEVLNSFAGEKATERKYQGFAEEKRAWKQEQESFKSEKANFEYLVKNFVEFAKQGDPFGTAALLAESAGEDPLVVVRNLRKGMVDAAIRYSQLTDAQREALDEREELVYSRKKVDAERKKLDNERALETQIKQVDAAINGYGLESREQFKETLEEVVEKVNTGQLTLTENLSADYVGRYHQSKVYVGYVNDALSKMGYSDDFDAREIATAAAVAAQNRLTKEQVFTNLKQHITGTVTQAARQLNDKLPPGARVSQKPKSTRPQEIDEETLSWLGLD